MITKQTILYGLQEHGIELQCTEDDINRYIAFLLYLDVKKVPQLKMAWSKELKLTAITVSMSRGRFEKIKQCFTITPNNLKKEL